MCSREKGEAPGRLHKATKKRRGTKCHQNLTFLKFGNRPSCRPACFRGWQSPITSEWNITRHTRHNRNSRHNSLQLDAISKHSLCFWGSFFTWAFKTSRIGKWHFLQQILRPPRNPLQNSRALQTKRRTNFCATSLKIPQLFTKNNS